MKDSLEEFIDKNRDAFDDQVPAGKLWQRILAALPGMKTTSLWSSALVWRAAAVVFFALSAWLLIDRTRSSDVRREQAMVQGDFRDLESFYSKQIAEKAELINDYDANGENDQFTQDFQKLEAMYQVLADEMKAHPGMKLKDAMILNLLVRVDMLNQQLKKLEDSREKKRAAPAQV